MRALRTFSIGLVALTALLLAGELVQAQTSNPDAAPASTTAVTQPSAPAATSSDEDLGAVYNRKLYGIEERVNGLKEKVFRSKARLLLLRETVLHGVVSGAKAILYHINELGAEYAMESITYFLDGTKIYSRTDTTGELAKKDEIKIFEGSIPPGNHQVTVNMVLRGHGFSVFSYLNQYTLRVQGSYSFIAQEGKVSRLKIIAYEKKGIPLEFKDRPSFRYDLQTDRNLATSEGAQ